MLALTAAVSLPALASEIQGSPPHFEGPSAETPVVKLAQASPEQAPGAPRAVATSQGWLGVKIKDVTPEIMTGEGVQSLIGAYVLETTPMSPASSVLTPGDIVLGVDNQEVISAHDLASKIQRLAPGSEVKLKIWREHAVSETSVKLGALPPSGQPPN